MKFYSNSIHNPQFGQFVAFQSLQSQNFDFVRGALELSYLDWPRPRAWPAIIYGPYFGHFGSTAR